MEEQSDFSEFPTVFGALVFNGTGDGQSVPQRGSHQPAPTNANSVEESEMDNRRGRGRMRNAANTPDPLPMEQTQPLNERRSVRQRLMSSPSLRVAQRRRRFVRSPRFASNATQNGWQRWLNRIRSQARDNGYTPQSQLAAAGSNSLPVLPLSLRAGFPSYARSAGSSSPVAVGGLGTDTSHSSLEAFSSPSSSVFFTARQSSNVRFRGVNAQRSSRQRSQSSHIRTTYGNREHTRESQQDLSPLAREHLRTRAVSVGQNALLSLTLHRNREAVAVDEVTQATESPLADAGNLIQHDQVDPEWRNSDVSEHND